jgi:hypothetical protein
MKRNLGARIATAVALAGIAAALTACGGNNNNAAAAACVPTGYTNNCLVGNLTGGGVINPAAGGFTIGFTGTAVQQGDGLYAGSGVGLPLTITGAQVGSVQTGTGSYQYGRIGTDGTILEFNVMPINGSQMQIQGVLSLSQLQYSVDAPYLATAAPQLTIYNVAAMPMSEAASVIGNQPFQYALWSGQVYLNGSVPVNPY